MGPFKFNLLLLLSFLSVHLSAFSNELIVGYGKFNAEPYTIIKDGKLVSGIIKNIMDRVGEELGIKIQYVEVPRVRYPNLLKKGSVHIDLISNRKWLKKPQDYHWSLPIFKEKDIIVLNKKNTFPISKAADLSGKKLGTILGYKYTKQTEKLIAKKFITRVDVYSVNNSLEMLKRLRVDAVLDSDILVKHYIKKHNLHDILLISDWVESEHFIEAALSKKAPITLSTFNKVLKKLKKNGEIQHILKEYR